MITAFTGSKAVMKGSSNYFFKLFKIRNADNDKWLKVGRKFCATLSKMFSHVNDELITSCNEWLKKALISCLKYQCKVTCCTHYRELLSLDIDFGSKQYNR